MKTIKVELKCNIPDETGMAAVVEAMRQGAQMALATAVLLQPKGKPSAVLMMDDYIEGVQELSIEDGTVKSNGD